MVMSDFPLVASSSRHSSCAPLDQRHVKRMLEVRLADDPAVSMRGAELVSRRELLEPENTEASPRG
jgi:hypothetical protein